MLRRAAAALDEIAAEPGQLRLVDLGERLGLAKSTARRLLVGLVEVGLASVDPMAVSRWVSACWDSAAPPARTSRRYSGRPSSRSPRSPRRNGRPVGAAWPADVVRRPDRIVAPAPGGFGGRRPVSAGRNRQRKGGAGGARLMPKPRSRSPGSSADDADRLRREIAEIRSTGIAFDRDEHTPGISAAAIARRSMGDNVVAISVPTPTERFLEEGAAHSRSIARGGRLAGLDTLNLSAGKSAATVLPSTVAMRPPRD